MMVVLCHHGADLCDPSQIAEMFQFIQDKCSQGPDNNAGSPPSTPPAVEIVCVCHTHSRDRAGMQYVGPIESFPADKWDQVLAVNLSASFHTIKLALPGMRERGMTQIRRGVTACGSIHTHTRTHTLSLSLSPSLSQVVALETAGSGVTCNAICPGWVLTPRQ